MKEDFVAYDNLRVAPYDFVYIKDMKIVNDINDHATLKISGVIDDEMKDSYVLSTDEETKIQIYYEKDNESITLFRGVVTNIKVSVVEEVYIMTVEAKSFTYKLDIYKVKKDFQNINMTTHELIHEVMKPFPHAVYDINIPIATNSACGLLSKEDKVKLDNLSSGGSSAITEYTEAEITALLKQIRF